MPIIGIAINLNGSFDLNSFKIGDKNSITIFGQSAGAAAVHLFTLIPDTCNMYKRAIASSGSMLCPWSYTKKNHTKILQKLIADEKSTQDENVSLAEIVAYLESVDGRQFGEKTFAPVYESGKSIKEIDLVWAPVIESMCIASNCSFEIEKKKK